MTGVDPLWWLPPLPAGDDAWRLLQSAVAPPEQKLQAIRRLASHRLDFVATTKLDRALTRVLATLPGTALPAMKVAWLASSTIDHLVPATRIGGLRRGVLPELWVGPYGQWRQLLLDDTGPLRQLKPDAILVSVHPQELLPRVPLGASAAEAQRAIDQTIEELVTLWRQGRDRFGALMIQETAPQVDEPLFGSHDLLVPGSPTRIAHAFNLALADAAKAEGVALVDLAAWAARLGSRTLFDPVRWHQAKQLVSPVHAPLYGDIVARVLAAARGLSRKCLVLDLDNTLWGGVVGDDGIDGIVLGQGSASGEAFQTFQRQAKALGERGVLLAVCSKNDPATAEEAFARHPEMILRRQDISAFVANWDDKATNLRTVASILNIGLEALVFFDDNPMERALIRRELPQVAVPEVPDDPAAFTQVLADAGYFEAVTFTPDDQARTAQYQANARREELRMASTDMRSFLQSLQMVMEVGPVDDLNLGRVTQLVNKTNQWNVRTMRYTEAELRDFIAQPGTIALHARLKDNLGDNGLIAVLLAKPEHDGALFIDTWLMSCRVLGRGVEKALFNSFAALAGRRGIAAIEGEYLPTAKNGMVRELYQSLGFEPTSVDHLGPGSSRWRMALNAFRPFETCIVAASLHD